LGVKNPPSNSIQKCISTLRMCLDGRMFWGNVIFLGIQMYLFKFLVWINNLKNFKNEGNLWSILSKLNLRNFKWHLKAKNLKFLLLYQLIKITNWSKNLKLAEKLKSTINPKNRLKTQKIAEKLKSAEKPKIGQKP
jgi:hypothetical protein